MFRLFKSLIYLSLPVLTLILLADSCRKKDAYPGQQLPQINTVSPSAAIVGTPVVIKGINLKDVSDVRFGTVEAAQFNASANTDTAIHVVVPDSLPVGDLYVQVYLKDGKGYGTYKFTVTLTPPVPKIDSVSPSTAYPGNTVTISGTNFALVTSIKFGGIVASFAHTLDTNGKLTAIVPANATGGNQFLTVINPNGSDSIAFNVNLAPVITGVNPASGTVGSTVTIQGVRFDNITSVQLGTVNTNYTVVNDTTITFVVPNGAVTGNITVTNALGTAVSPAAFLVLTTEYFIYQDALSSSWWTGGSAPAVGWGNITNMQDPDTVESGTNAISVNYNVTGGYGGFQIGTNTPVDLTPYSALKLSVFGGAGSDGNKIEVYINGQYAASVAIVLNIAAGKWTDFTIPLSTFGSPSTISALVVQEYSGVSSETIYIDNIGLQ